MNVNPHDCLPECNQFQGYRRRICRGEDPSVPREKVNEYRAAWGFAPLPEDWDPYRPPPGWEPPPPPSLPTLTQQVLSFASAFVNHARDGFTRCEPDEIQKRLEICQACPSFTGVHCRECGCACNSSNVFLNKLAWHSEACPLGRW